LRKKEAIMKITKQSPKLAASSLMSVVLIAAALLVSGVLTARAQQDGNAGVVPPNATFYGRTYGEWSAKWWEWFMEFPVQDKQGNPLPHPSFDDPNFNVRDRQQGDVWFLGETSPIMVRTCDIPLDKSLFVALHTAESSNLEGLGNTEAEQRANSEWTANHIVGSFFEIDGQPVADIESYRVTSPQFKFDAPTPWVFGATGGKGTSVGDGYYVLLKPLSKGQHTIHYGGTFHFSVAEGDPFDLEIPSDSTYHLNVK